MSIEQSIKDLLQIVSDLQNELIHTKRTFTLDGKLVGDIGEILVSVAYDVELVDPGRAEIDAKDSFGRQVQIKTTMKDSLYLYPKHTPHYLIAIEIDREGSFREIFNGPGQIVWDAFAKPNSPYIFFPKKKTYELKSKVEPSEHIALRPEFVKDAQGWIRRK